MAFPTAVNNQITDAVTQTNVKVLGEAPAAVDPALLEDEEKSGQASEAAPQQPGNPGQGGSGGC